MQDCHLRKEPALRSYLPAGHCHPERKRRISVRIAGDKIVSKYRSAGRLPFGIQVYVECLFAWQRSTPLRHSVALFAPVGSMSLDSQIATLPYESSSFAT